MSVQQNLKPHGLIPILIQVKSFYYVRVLENPTCRWSTWDAIKAGLKPRAGLHQTIQERAWTSPIWYIPQQDDLDIIPLAGSVSSGD